MRRVRFVTSYLVAAGGGVASVEVADALRLSGALNYVPLAVAVVVVGFISVALTIGLEPPPRRGRSAGS